ncbi:MAG: glycerol-3-phosphate 1-O-acyltransferase PlsY [Verrucomicrobiota bacterium]
MIEFLQTWWPVPLAYFIGATPFGFLAGKIKGIDIRDYGSGNIGATNAIRVLGKPLGIPVLILDILKGMAPVVISLLVSENTVVPIATSVAAILGHNYTFWLGFKGGKGIATTAGAVIPILTLAILIAIIVWLVFVKVTRYVSVASIAGAISIPITVLTQNLVTGKSDLAVFLFALFVGALAIWKHRSNIARLHRGEEPRTKPKKSSTPST